MIRGSQKVRVVNPQCKCASRVTVVRCVCVCVCLSVCLLSHILSMECTFVLKTLSRTQQATKVCEDFPERTVFKSYAVKHERKNQYANYSNLPWSAFSA